MCLYPKLIQNKKYTATKKNGGVIPAVTDERVLAIPVGCGKCIECRKKKAREWQVRLLEDVRHKKNGKFVTLTFSNESIAELYNEREVKELKGYEKDNKAATIAVRRFLERWRKENKKSVRHWLVTELGHNGTENIHLHGIIWTNNIEQISKHWKYGWVWDGKPDGKGGKINYVSERTVNYITKYINKLDFDHKYYEPKILTSAGIGGGYMERQDRENNKYNGENTKEFYQTRNGSKIMLPMYWRNKIYNDDEKEKLWIIKLDEKIRWVNGVKIDVSKGMEQYYNVLKEAREKNERLGYGNNEKDWNREMYEKQRRTLLQEERIQAVKSKWGEFGEHGAP